MLALREEVENLAQVCPLVDSLPGMALFMVPFRSAGCGAMNAVAHMTSALLITYTLFPDVTPATKTERADVPWEILVENIRKAPTYINKAACPLISIAEYGELRTDKDCLRHAANVNRIFGVEIDYDGEQMPIEEAAAILDRAHICSVLYTSPSHTPERPRWRALLPLSEPALPDKRREYVGRANQLLGGVATRESFTLSQSFYLGRVRGAEYVVVETIGRYIDMAADIEPLYHVGGVNDGESARDATTDDQLRSAFVRGEDRYQAMLKLSSRWAARGMQQDDIEAALHALLDQCPSTKNADGIDLRTRVRAHAESAVRKFGETRAPALPVGAAAPPDAPTATDAAAIPAVRQPMDWAKLAASTPPVRSWRISHWLTAGPTLLAGPGGIGKTLIAQTIATALALGQRFLDDVHESSTVLFWACEDDHDELWRRQVAICKYFGVDLRDLAGKLFIEPRLGCENTLFTTVYGSAAWTPLREELAAQVADYKASVLFLDNIGQTFGAKENDRHHVTVFLNGLTGLGPTATFTPVIMGHPAKAIGSEFSGSTAWENGVRMRWFMGAALPDQKEPEEGEQDPNVRYLSKRKTNYSVRDYRKLIYTNGVFVPEELPGEVTQRYSYPMRLDGAEKAILYALGKFQEAGVRTTDARTSPDYLPKKMREAKLASDYAPKELGEALMRLRLSGRVAEGVVGKFQNRTVKRGLVCT